MLLNLALALVIASALADDTEPAADTKARELKIEKGVLPRLKSNLGDPTKITSKEELEKAIPDKDTAALLAKQVDFKKEFVLLFAWAGSGGDRLTLVQGKEVVFTMQRGRTRDLRQHAKLFALPKGMKYRMSK